MGSHGHTRRAAYEAACALAAEGKRPSAKAIRERLGGGGQQALLAGLNDWVDEAARRFLIPALPEELRTTLVAIWDLACREGEARWEEQRAALQRSLTEEAQAHATTRAAREAATAAIGEQTAAITRLREELQQALDAGQAAQSELEARTQELHQRQTTLEEVAAARGALAKRLDHEQRVAVAARESLEHAQARIAALQAQSEVAAARVDMLEHAEAEAKAKAAETRADLERSQKQTDALGASLAERDGQIATLSAAVEREQKARDGDAKHWLARIEDLQATIAGYRDRETQLLREKDESAKVINQLRDELGNALALLRAEREQSAQKKAQKH